MDFKINLDQHYHPQLAHQRATYISVHGAHHFHELEHYSLNFIHNQGDLDNERSYKLAIRYYHGDEEGPHHFAMYEMSMGDHIELLTGEEWSNRIEAIAQHEGYEEAERWQEKQVGNYPTCRIMTQWEFALQEKLKQRWLAVCELISPNVTL